MNAAAKKGDRPWTGSVQSHVPVGWDDIVIHVFRSPNWLLRDSQSPIYVAANTPMYE